MTRALTSTCVIALFVSVGVALAGSPQKAPAIVGPTVTGGKASLAALRGKPVFVNVWSSW